MVNSPNNNINGPATSTPADPFSGLKNISKSVTFEKGSEQGSYQISIKYGDKPADVLRYNAKVNTQNADLSQQQLQKVIESVIIAAGTTIKRDARNQHLNRKGDQRPIEYSRLRFKYALSSSKIGQKALDVVDDQEDEEAQHVRKGEKDYMDSPAHREKRQKKEAKGDELESFPRKLGKTISEKRDPPSNPLEQSGQKKSTELENKPQPQQKNTAEEETSFRFTVETKTSFATKNSAKKNEHPRGVGEKDEKSATRTLLIEKIAAVAVKVIQAAQTVFSFFRLRLTKKEYSFEVEESLIKEEKKKLVEEKENEVPLLKNRPLKQTKEFIKLVKGEKLKKTADDQLEIQPRRKFGKPSTQSKANLETVLEEIEEAVNYFSKNPTRLKQTEKEILIQAFSSLTHTDKKEEWAQQICKAFPEVRTKIQQLETQFFNLKFQKDLEDFQTDPKNNIELKGEWIGERFCIRPLSVTDFKDPKSLHPNTLSELISNELKFAALLLSPEGKEWGESFKFATGYEFLPTFFQVFESIVRGIFKDLPRSRNVVSSDVSLQEQIIDSLSTIALEQSSQTAKTLITNFARKWREKLEKKPKTE